MKKSPIERSRPYLIPIGFCVIAMLPVISSRLNNGYPRINWYQPLNEQVQKFAPVGSSTPEAIRMLESNGCECSTERGNSGSFTMCQKYKWILIGASVFQISIYGRDVIEKIEYSGYNA